MRTKRNDENGSIINNFIGSLLSKGKQAHQNIPSFDISKQSPNHAPDARRVGKQDAAAVSAYPATGEESAVGNEVLNVLEQAVCAMCEAVSHGFCGGGAFALELAEG